MTLLRRYQLIIEPVDPTFPDITGFESGDCANMFLRDMEVSIYSNLLVKYVLFNNTVADWWMSPNTPNSNWVSWPIHQPLSAFNPDVPTGENTLTWGVIDKSVMHIASHIQAPTE